MPEFLKSSETHKYITKELITHSQKNMHLHIFWFPYLLYSKSLKKLKHKNSLKNFFEIFIASIKISMGLSFSV